ncbi:MAG: metal-dependent transcriptional regulator [Chloroflexota bacterium]
MNGISDLQLNYLAEIYHVSHLEKYSENETVTSSDLAIHIGATQSSVNRMMERLKKSSLIRHEPYVGLYLTEKGKAIAIHILRKQAIIETFLFSVMNIVWHRVYEEAKLIRHNVNDTVLERMYQLSGQPKRSPYGAWIDSTQLNQHHEERLSNAEIKQDYAITSVSTRQPDRLEYIEAIGLTPDTSIKLLHKAPFNGPLQIQLGYEYRILGYELAEMLTVTSIEESS